MNSTINYNINSPEVLSGTSNTENCITCGINTGVRVNTPIDFRDYYIEGAGQLCVRCYNSTYNNPSTYSDNSSIGEL